MRLGARIEFISARGLGAILSNLFVLLLLLTLALPAHAQSNSPPFFQSGSVHRLIKGDSQPGHAVGAPVLANDPDGADTLTYTLSGLDGVFFAIDGSSGQLWVIEPLDHDVRSRFFVMVRATDSGGLYDTVPVTIDVTDVDGLGDVVLSTSDVRVGTELSATLNDLEGNLSIMGWQWANSPDKVTWTDIAHADSATYMPMAADLGKHLRARATYVDNYGTVKTSESLTGKVLEPSQINFPPEFPYFESGVREVIKAIPVGELVGVPVLASDLDQDLLTYQLSGEAAAFFTIDPQTAQLQAKNSIESQQLSRYFGVVDVFDGRGGSDSLTLRIDVVDMLPERGPAAASEQQAGNQQEPVSTPAPNVASSDPQKGTVGSNSSGPAAHDSGAAATPVADYAAVSKQTSDPTSVGGASSPGVAASSVSSAPISSTAQENSGADIPARAREGSGGNAKEQEEAVADIERPGYPTSLQEEIAGESQTSSGLPKLIPFLPGWLNWFLLTFVLGVVALLAWMLLNRDKMEPLSVRTTLPAPSVGPVRRIAPLRPLAPSKGESGDSQVDSDQASGSKEDREY